MRIISVINYKGGVGKTTLTANLASELAYRGHRVLLIDVDPQASLTFSFVTPEYWQTELANDCTIKNWLTITSAPPEVSFSDLILSPKRVNDWLANSEGQLDLIASHLELINVDLELATLLGGATMRQAKERFVQVHTRIESGLAQLETDAYDYVLIDCPPNFNIITKNAIVASDYVLVPAKPDYLSTLGIDYLRRSIDALVHDFNEYANSSVGDSIPAIAPEWLGVVFTMIQLYRQRPIGATRPFIQQTRDLELPVFNTMMRKNNTMFADASQYGVPVVLQNYSSGTHKEVREELEALVDEFISRI